MRRARAHLLVLPASIIVSLAGCDVAGNRTPVAPISPSGPDSNPGPLNDGLLDPPPPGTPSTEGVFPRLCAFAGDLDKHTASERDTLARFEVVSVRAAPDDVSSHLARNPDARLFYRIMPQVSSVIDWSRTWSWMDTVHRYARANEWLLRHQNGEEATARGWGGYWLWLDFTSRCPQGTYFDESEPELDSRGLSVAVWMSTRFIPWFVANRMAGYEGFWWEVVAEAPSRLWFWFDVSDEANGRLDWNRNGVSDFSEGGWTEFDRFVADWSRSTARWLHEIRVHLGPDYPIIAGGDAHAPALEYFQGFKNEDFLNRNAYHGPRWSWWDEFYTTSFSRPRRGYHYQRDHAGEGWRLSVNQIFWYDDSRWQFSDPDKRRQYVRFALGTTLLGDGLFSFYDVTNTNENGQPRNPWISEYYDLELGTHAYPMERHVFGADTVYTRHFHDGADAVTGFVAVNPGDAPLAGIAARDAVIRAY